MKRTIIILLVLVLGVVIFLKVAFKGPDLASYAYLKEPRITRLADQKVIEVYGKGDPDSFVGKAFGFLYKHYFKLPGTSLMKMPLPRGRWIAGPEIPRLEWQAYLSLPVAEDVTTLAEIKDDSDFKAELKVWQYGDVAEILHIGDYENESQSIQKLKDFVASNGYVISGLHEEEYLKGPGMFMKGNPKNYQTVIRYQVKKK
jgi:hypothetical protein